jgi:hypothetical protein
MRIYLDSRDLIVLVERKSAQETAHFEEKLRRSASDLIYSMHNIMECCAPLIRGDTRSTVMRTLNRLEELPHVYVAETRIEALELNEAKTAFLEGKEYAQIDLPIVPRFDYVVSAFSDCPTKQYLHYGLAHIVYELWNTDRSLLNGYPTHAKRLQKLLDADRKRDDYKRHGPNFQNAIARNLRLYGIQFPAEKIQVLSDWIYENPARCPAARLGYEVYHKILRNSTDTGEMSDIPDFAHISVVPYCDAITLDNRIRGYIAQVDQSIGTSFTRKMYRNVDEIEGLLQRTAA